MNSFKYIRDINYSKGSFPYLIKFFSKLLDNYEYLRYTIKPVVIVHQS